MRIKSKKPLIKKWLIGILLTALIIVFSFVFIKHYRELCSTLEKERITYISELKNLLVKNINEEKEHQMELVEIYERTLLAVQPRTFKEIKSLLGTFESGEKEQGNKIFLMDKKGQIYDLDGNKNFFSEAEIGRMLVAGKETVFSHAEVKNKEQYWICGQPILDYEIEDITICAIIQACNIDDFTKRLTVNMFDNNASSFLIKKDGSIVVTPSLSISGYNIFYTLKKWGAEQDIIEKMQQDFDQGKAGQQLLTFNENRWLIDYSESTYENWVVVILMPMTITAADTYTMMHRTLISVGLLLASILMFLIYIIILFYRSEQNRNQSLQQEKLQLEMSQKVAESKAQFLAKMSHDIRTPLNAIIGLLQIMIEQNQDMPKVVNNLTKANTSANYLLGILNDILDMSKIESGKMTFNPTPTNINDILDGLRSLNEIHVQEKDIIFNIYTEGKLKPAYMMDKLRINQILMNLLSNAIKFTPAGGTITLSVEKVGIDDSWDRMIFRVKDTGIGMSEEFCSNLFEPFIQENSSISASYGGSGLGLAIVKNLVEMMDGEIIVNSKKGEGTQFVITMLVKGADLPALAEAKTEHKSDVLKLKGKTFMLVEDIEINAEIATEILQSHFDVHVDIAENGKIALDKFMASEPGTYSVIFMDIQMPIMNGLDATRAIRNLQHPDAETIPIFAMSANAFEDDVKKSIEYGMNEHLSKPIDIVEIKRVLIQYLLEK